MVAVVEAVEVVVVAEAAVMVAVEVAEVAVEVAEAVEEEWMEAQRWSSSPIATRESLSLVVRRMLWSLSTRLRVSLCTEKSESVSKNRLPLQEALPKRSNTECGILSVPRVS
jgi:hypothetical protein